MTAAMVAMHRLLPAPQQYPLPPRLITEQLLDRDQSETSALAFTMINHFGFGAVAGALYCGLALDERYPRISGPAFGTAVWAASYLGWVPAFKLLPPATRQPAERNALMIAAHLVWGAALAGAASALAAPSGHARNLRGRQAKRLSKP